ncbi:hypothetical protein DL765_007635 [Monosporascus sp. GIB2]|nr:hypothetical protein DL765_007635 [Monosporascus sp. GIB2]
MGQSAGRVSAPATPEPQPEQAQSHSAHPKMQANFPGPRETIVSSVPGNTARSDNASPVAVQHHAQGVIITPPPSRPAGPETTRDGCYKLLRRRRVYGQGALRPPDPADPRGANTARCTPAHGADASAPGRGKGQGQADITAVELYTGREPLGALGEGAPKERWQRSPLPAHDDFEIHLGTGIHGASQDGLAENPGRPWGDAGGRVSRRRARADDSVGGLAADRQGQGVDGMLDGHVGGLGGGSGWEVVAIGPDIVQRIEREVADGIPARRARARMKSLNGGFIDPSTFAYSVLVYVRDSSTST